MSQLLKSFADFLWFPIMFVLLLGSAVIMSLKLKFLQITKIRQIYKSTIGSLFAPKSNNKRAISPFAAVTTALAGTMGIGNIAGVATAICAGGPGSIFWMWVSGFFCMIVKYAEVLLAVKFREKKGDLYIGGPMHYITKGMNNRTLAVIFAVCCVFTSFGIGNMTQSNTIAISVRDTLNIPPLYTGIIIAVIAAMIIIGGISRIASFTSTFIPFMSALYILVSVGIIVYKGENLLPALKLIVSDAFSLKQVGAGLFGFAMLKNMRFGISRGIFSNEAGLGSAPIAHAAADTDSAVKQGMWGIFEVFFDTIVVCTMTALVILTTGVYGISGLDGIELTGAAFASCLGGISQYFLMVSIIFFALSSIISWSLYGEYCVKFLTFNPYAPLIYKLIFLTVIIIGACTQLDIVWILSDILNVFMAIPNIIGVFKLSGIVVRETKSYAKISLTE